MSSTPTLAPWGSGDPIPGTPFRTLVPSASTGDRMVVLSADMPPGLHVDEHVHQNEDQVVVVIEGTVGASIGDQRLRLTEGSVVFMPRGVPHALWNEGSETARTLDIYSPGGFEKVFEAWGAGEAG